MKRAGILLLNMIAPRVFRVISYEYINKDICFSEKKLLENEKRFVSSLLSDRHSIVLSFSLVHRNIHSGIVSLVFLFWFIVHIITNTQAEKQEENIRTDRENER